MTRRGRCSSVKPMLVPTDVRQTGVFEMPLASGERCDTDHGLPRGLNESKGEPDTDPLPRAPARNQNSSTAEKTSTNPLKTGTAGNERTQGSRGGVPQSHPAARQPDNTSREYA